MRKLLVVAVLAAFMSAAVGTSVAAGDSGDRAGTADRAPTFVWAPLMLGDSESHYGAVYELLPADYEVGFILPVGTGTLTVEIVDCCTEGNKMAGAFIWRGGGMDVLTAETPETIVKSIPVSRWTWVAVIIGYTYFEYGGGTGYDIYADFF